MKIKPYSGVGNISFNDSYDKVRSKLMFDYDENVFNFMDKKYPRLYIKELDLIINFHEDYNSIRFFEFFKEASEVSFNGMNMINKPYSELLRLIKGVDSNIEVNDSDFTSKELGVTVGREVIDSEYSEEVTSIVVFDDKYYSEPEIDLEELYKSITGEEYPS